MADNCSPHSSELYILFKHSLKDNGFKGDVCLDLANRLLNATDNSIYEVLPQAIVQPRNLADIELLCKIANYKEFRAITFTPRGGGTGTNGQSLTDGVVVDVCRYMHHILDFNPEELTVTVEPGVILSDLNTYLRPHGLFFAPMVSTANRATIGGMIATDAAGKGSLVYGKTNDHLLSLQCVLINGDLHEFKAIPRDLDNTILDSNSASLQPSIKQQNITQQVLDLLTPDEVQAEIAARFRPSARPLSGYNLRQCVTANTIDLTKLIAGSEGTLAFIAAATLKLTKIPKYNALVVVHYTTFLAALADADFLIQHQPIAIEAVDEKVQSSATSLPVWPALADLMELAPNEFMVSNFIEFAEDDLSILENKLIKLHDNLDLRKSRYVIIRQMEQINQLWSIRSLAVGLAGKIAGQAKPVAFVEDVIVPPQNLYNFVAEFKDLLERHGLNYAMYGHVDVGCIHVRPALNMQSNMDRSQIRNLTTEVLLLVERYHGLLWGEHGKGVRGEFVAQVFGLILYPILQKIKWLFDPENRLNPQKLVTSNNVLKVSRIDEIPFRGVFDEMIRPELQEWYSGALLCNGNGACFNRDSYNVMCPSYKATGDRIHSPKGRAMLLKEWLRLRSTNAQQNKVYEIADLTFAAMGGCLGCKGCASQCPTQVSIPDLRSKFLHEYHAVYRKRSFKEFILAYAENLLNIVVHTPKLWNFLVKHKLVPTFGILHQPQLSLTTSLRDLLAKHQIGLYDSEVKNGADLLPMEVKPIIIVADVFTAFLDHDVLISSCKVLKKMGYTPYVLYPKASGKAFLVAGMLNEFKQQALQLESRLQKIFVRDIPVIGIENSITLMYRDEYKKFAVPLSGHIYTLAEFLVQQVNILKNKISNDNVEYCLLPHCTEQAQCPQDAQNWQLLFAAVGLKLAIANLGCCGMAGTYGHIMEHQTTSKWLFNKNWQSKIINAKVQYLATGYSCRSQANILAAMRLPHPVQVFSSILE